MLFIPETAIGTPLRMPALAISYLDKLAFNPENWKKILKEWFGEKGIPFKLKNEISVFQFSKMITFFLKKYFYCLQMVLFKLI